MKNRVTTLDIVTLILELREKLVGLRVDQLYDIDKKTYLVRLAKTGTKIVLLIESGARFHTTNFEWPKNAAPSGFTMKLRKHLNNKRLESINQVGADRVIDFQFGSGPVAVHLLLELYDKGNIILTDDNYNILSLVRPHIQGEDRLVAHEKYTIDKAKQAFSLTEDTMFEVLEQNPGKSLREILLPKVEFGPSLFSHVLKKIGMSLQTKIPSKEGSDEQFREFGTKLFEALENGRKMLEAPEHLERGGFIVTQQQSKPQQQTKSKSTGKNVVVAAELNTNAKEDKPTNTNLVIYDQYQPIVLCTDFPESSIVKFPGLDEAMDEFYSKLEAQKLDMKQLNQEKEAYKKLERVKEDQRNRLNELKQIQQVDKEKGELIMFNQEIIYQAIGVIRQLIANQIPWDDIWQQIKEAQSQGDPIAKRITSLHLIKNQFKMLLEDPYQGGSSEDGEDDEEEENTQKGKSSSSRPDIEVEIDLNLSAFGNSTKFFDMKKTSAKKEERTLESQEKVFKSTEKKTLTTLREITTIQSIKKLRKIYWFEKFHWFVSSDNFIVLGGHDAQQNELLVKRYLSPHDVYLHADSHGAPTIIIKNYGKLENVPPKTLNEAGTLAVCASGSWETKIITTCWWVWGHQVSKSAPTGEYLPTGSFMIRGKKNYLPPCQLILGFGFLFRLTDESVVNHKGERGTRGINRAAAGADPREKNAEAEQTEKLDVQEVSEPQADENGKNTSSDSDGANDEEPSGDEDNIGEDEFPDTEIQLQLDKDPVVKGTEGGRLRTLSSVSSEYSTFSNSTAMTTLTTELGPAENYVIVQSGVLPGFSADASKGKKKGDKGKKGSGGGGGGGKKSGKEVAQGGNASSQRQQQQQQRQQVDSNVQTFEGQEQAKPKRGQHGRQKKLKEKYKFQDDDEREMRMQLLQSKGKQQRQQARFEPSTVAVAAGGAAPKSKSKKPDKLEESREATEICEKVGDDEAPNKENAQDRKHEELAPPLAKTTVKSELPPEEPQQEEPVETAETETDFLDNLTGSPLEQDELLFAIPMIGPYQAMQNYKFRIKLIPGSTKRGKAAKTAIELFTRDKNTRQREKDLIKSVKDQDLARNFPGKVKLAGGAIDSKKK